LDQGRTLGREDRPGTAPDTAADTGGCSAPWCVMDKAVGFEDVPAGVCGLCAAPLDSLGVRVIGRDVQVLRLGEKPAGPK
jgi:hypothetical protein